MYRTHRYLIPVMFLLVGLAAAQPSLFLPTPSTLPVAEPQVEKAGEWPEGVPLPEDAHDKVSMQTKCRFVGTLRTEQSREELVDLYRRTLLEQGWKVESLHEERTFFRAIATDPTRALTVHTSRYRGAEEVKITVQHINAACATEPEDLEARALLERMRQSYASAVSYADRGIYRGIISVSEQVTEVEVPVAFSTAFVRPSSFRYEVVNILQRKIIHVDGKGHRSHWPVDDEEKESGDLVEAVSNLSSIPAEASALFPGLLIQGEAGRLPLLSQARIAGEETLTGAKCLVVECRDDACMPMRFWIGVADAMVRRFESYDITPEALRLDVVEFEPVLNAPISDDTLAFNKNGQLELLDPIAPSILERLLQGVRSIFW